MSLSFWAISMSTEISLGEEKKEEIPHRSCLMPLGMIGKRHSDKSQVFFKGMYISNLDPLPISLSTKINPFRS